MLKGGLLSTQQHGPTVSSDRPCRDASIPAARQTQTRGSPRGGGQEGMHEPAGPQTGEPTGGGGEPQGEGAAHRHHDRPFPSGLGPGLPVSLDFRVSPWTRGVGPPLLPTRSRRAGSCAWGALRAAARVPLKSRPHVQPVGLQAECAQPRPGRQLPRRPQPTPSDPI